MEEEDAVNMELAHYIEIGAVTLEGVDENGEIIFAIQEKAKDIAPELWDAHIRHVDDSLMKLYDLGLMEVEYDENLEATLHLSPEGHKMAKELGLIQIDMPDSPQE